MFRTYIKNFYLYIKVAADYVDRVQGLDDTVCHQNAMCISRIFIVTSAGLQDSFAPVCLGTYFAD